MWPRVLLTVVCSGMMVSDPVTCQIDWPGPPSPYAAPPPDMYREPRREPPINPDGQRPSPPTRTSHRVTKPDQGRDAGHYQDGNDTQTTAGGPLRQTTMKPHYHRPNKSSTMRPPHHHKPSYPNTLRPPLSELPSYYRAEKPPPHRRPTYSGTNWPRPYPRPSSSMAREPHYQHEAGPTMKSGMRMSFNFEVSDLGKLLMGSVGRRPMPDGDEGHSSKMAPAASDCDKPPMSQTDGQTDGQAHEDERKTKPPHPMYSHPYLCRVDDDPSNMTLAERGCPHDMVCGMYRDIKQANWTLSYCSRPEEHKSANDSDYQYENEIWPHDGNGKYGANGTDMGNYTHPRGDRPHDGGDMGDHDRPHDGGDMGGDMGDHEHPHDGGDMGDHDRPHDGGDMGGDMGDHDRPHDGGDMGDHDRPHDGGDMGDHDQPHGGDDMGDHDRPHDGGDMGDHDRPHGGDELGDPNDDEFALDPDESSYGRRPMERSSNIRLSFNFELGNLREPERRHRAEPGMGMTRKTPDQGGRSEMPPPHGSDEQMRPDDTSRTPKPPKPHHPYLCRVHDDLRNMTLAERDCPGDMMSCGMYGGIKRGNWTLSYCSYMRQPKTPTYSDYQDQNEIWPDDDQGSGYGDNEGQGHGYNGENEHSMDRGDDIAYSDPRPGGRDGRR